MLGFPVGVFVANGMEWYFHKVWLHEYPMQYRKSPFFTHIAHHKRARTQGFQDETYSDTVLRNADLLHEKGALVLLAGTATVFLPVAPFFTMGLYYGMWNYYRVHAKAHLDPEYARKRIPWHYDHHMTSNQNANWCVTRPWFDYIMGTRVFTSISEAETNPLGMKLPAWVEKRVNSVTKRLLPKAYAQIEANTRFDQEQVLAGVEVAL